MKLRNKITGQIVEVPDNQQNVPSLLSQKPTTSMPMQNKGNQEIATRALNKLLGKPEQTLPEKVNEVVATTKARINAEKEAKSPFQIMSADDRQYIQELKNVPNILSRVNALASDVPVDRTKATAYKVAMDVPLVSNFTTSANQRALKSNLELLIQTVVKSFQGSRPSDRDQAVIDRAINAIGEGRGNFKVALNELGDLAARRAGSYSETASLGWGIDKNTIDKLVGLNEIKKMGLNNKNNTQINTENPTISELKKRGASQQEIDIVKKSLGVQ